MKRYKIRQLIFPILIAGLLFGCREAEQADPQGKYQKTTDSSVFVVTDPGVLAARIEVKNSALEFDSTADASVLGIDSKPSAKKGGAVQDVALTLIAETNSVTTLGTTLQATDVITEGNKAYVSYNIAGSQFGGAIQTVDIKNSSSPRVINELVFDDIDVNSLYISGNTLYAAGAINTETRTLDTPAALLIVSLKGSQPDGSVEIVDLPSYAATDVLIRKSNIFVTVGAAGGGLVRLSENNPQSFSSSTDFFSLEDARSLAVEGNLLGVLKGTDGEVVYFDTNSINATLADTTPTRRVEFSGTATIANSKSTIDLLGKVSLMALGDGGVKSLISDSSDDSSIFEIAALINVDGLTDEVTVTNAVSASHELVFRANGEAGVDLHKLSKDIRSIESGDSVSVTQVGTIDFGTLMSANSVYYRKGLLYVADGLGGLKIVGVDRKFSSTDDEEEDSQEEDQDDEDDDE